jgi:hypothetical protein
LYVLNCRSTSTTDAEDSLLDVWERSDIIPISLARWSGETASPLSSAEDMRLEGPCRSPLASKPNVPDCKARPLSDNELGLRPITTPGLLLLTEPHRSLVFPPPMPCGPSLPAARPKSVLSLGTVDEVGDPGPGLEVRENLLGYDTARPAAGQSRCFRLSCNNQRKTPRHTTRPAPQTLATIAMSAACDSPETSPASYQPMGTMKLGHTSPVLANETYS